MPVMKVIPGTTKPERRLSLVTKRSVAAAAAHASWMGIRRPDSLAAADFSVALGGFEIEGNQLNELAGCRGLGEAGESSDLRRSTN
jgi:hypothetical protein